MYASVSRTMKIFQAGVMSAAWGNRSGKNEVTVRRAENIIVQAMREHRRWGVA